MKPYITWNEAKEKHEENTPTYRLLNADNGCMAGFCSGITVYSGTEYRKPGVHEDQEGFFVLQGEGYAILDDLEFPIAPGDSFVALPGVAHSVRAKSEDNPVHVLWFHGACNKD